jgi:hypothetical protein
MDAAIEWLGLSYRFFASFVALSISFAWCRLEGHELSKRLLG